MENSKQPAFSVSREMCEMSEITEYPYGLNKREYVAARAMQGVLSNSAETDVTASFVLEALGLPKETKYVFTEHYPAYLAKVSVGYADALLEALNKQRTTLVLYEGMEFEKLPTSICTTVEYRIEDAIKRPAILA